MLARMGRFALSLAASPIRLGVAAVFLGALAGPAVAQTGEVTGGHAYLNAVQVFVRGAPVCSGSFVEAGWILTAASCFDGGNTDVRVAGGAGSSKVLQVIQHPEYARWGAANDVALLKLAGPLDDAATAALGDAAPVRGDAVSMVGFAAGRLFMGQAGVLDSAACNVADAKRWCAASGDAAACYGDRGGPALDRTGRLVGIAATGCPRSGPVVFAAVAAYRAWIDEQVIGYGGRSGWYRQDGAEAEGWSIQFAGNRAFLGALGFDPATGAPTWTVTPLTRTSTGIYEGQPMACRATSSGRVCEPSGGRVVLAVATDRASLRLTSAPDNTVRLLVPYQP